MTTLYTFDLVTGEHTGEREAQTRPNGEAIVDVLGATPVAPPAGSAVPAFSADWRQSGSSAGRAAVWTGEAWALVPDHRQKRDSGGVAMEGTGTPYWLPGDTSETPARYMDVPGALPENAILEKPARPEPAPEEIKQAHINEIKAALDEIDRKSARPLRSVAAGTATDDDRSALADLEARASALRAELAALTGIQERQK